MEVWYCIGVWYNVFSGMLTIRPKWSGDLWYAQPDVPHAGFTVFSIMLTF
ncbi:hypothetical protein HanIR_Chr14g0688101 [Helianthus annuus]|nr:hypothetical protein HanIR_Chr14g0688101 [Helianthus annuus]